MSHVHPLLNNFLEFGISKTCLLFCTTFLSSAEQIDNVLLTHRGGRQTLESTSDINVYIYNKNTNEGNGSFVVLFEKAT